MGHLRKIRTVLTFSVFMALVSTGLSLAPASGSAQPPAAYAKKENPPTALLLGGRYLPAPAAGSQGPYGPGTGLLLQNGQAGASGCPGAAPAPGEHCVPLPVHLLRKEDNGPGTCSAIIFMQVPLLDSIVQYDATWAPPNEPNSPRAFTASGGPNGTGSGPFGAEEYWSTKEISDLGIVHKVPKGFGAWLLGAGGGRAPCTNLGPGVAQAWGWTAHPVVSGKVTLQGSGGQPAPGVSVRASCPSGGATTSDTKGAYGFVLKPGPCTIAPKLPAGEAPVPKQQVVNVATQDINNVDFVVPGGSLKVFVKQLEPLRSGLAVHSVHYKQYPADFTAVAPVDASAPNHFVCESGCVDITVTVVDPATHKAPDPHATVEASVDRMEMEEPTTFDGRPDTFGGGFLCETASDGSDTQCGTSLTRLFTDFDGQVHLRYWVPGVLGDAKATLTVTAHCGASPCTAPQTTSHMTLSVKPHEIYQHSAVLSAADVAEMDKWAGGGPFFTKFVDTSVVGYDVLKNALLALEKFEKATKNAKELLEGVEKVEPIAVLLDAGLKINDAFEAQGMFSLFLDISGLSPFGIGADPSEDSASGQPTVTFVRALMNQLALPDFLKGGNGGFWWASAQDIRRSEDASVVGAPDDVWSLGTTVYEVSHCDNQEGSCGPGYRNKPGSHLSFNRGIQPQLVIDLTLRRNNSPVEEGEFFIQYDALAWTTTQPNLEGVIQDF